MTAEHQTDDNRITYFGATHTRGKREMFGIRDIDRGKHVYVIGKTGMGKSTMLENMAIQDIQNGEGIAFIDPHGSTAEKLLDFVPYDRIDDVVYFAPFDTDHPMGFNVMEDVGYDKRHLVVSGLMGALKRIWVDAWSARMEYILQNTLLALLEYPGATLLDVNRMLTNKTFRNAVVDKITDPIVKAFWTEEFANFTDSYTREATPAIQNKIGQFTANPLIRNIVGQPTSTFDLRKMMDEKKIFIVNLSKGRMGETNASLLGSMLTVKIYLAAMSRADEPPTRMAKLPRFHFYVDEFQSMMNEAFADILSESRKYKLALTLANQYIEQMEEKVREAVFGNVGTLIVFRVGPFDAEVLKTVFEPTFVAEDLVGLGLGQIYLTLMIDGVGSAPFSAETIPPIDAPSISYKEDVIVRSRAHFAATRADVERVINEKQAEFVPPPRSEKKAMGGGGGNSNWRPQAGTQSHHAPQSSNPPRPMQSPPFRTNTDDRERREPRPFPREDRFAPQASVSAPVARERSFEVSPRREWLPPDRPRVDVPPPVSAPPAPDMRSSLRDAIAAVRVEPEPVRSPLEILREKQTAQGIHHTPRPVSPPPPTPPPAPVRPPQPRTFRPPQSPHHQPPPREQTTPPHTPPAHQADSAKKSAEEISEELVRRILKGDGE